MAVHNETGQIIANRYRLLEQLGVGSMGAVYRAKDRLDGETVALKRVLMPVQELSFETRGTASTTDPRVELAHEFQTLASLRHPNIVAVQDYGFDSGTYFTMQLIESPQNFFTALVDAPLSAKIDATLQVLQGLAYIHRRNILHRDLKPTNVLVKDGQVFIVDFGLALAYQGKVAQGQVAGTLAYMAPEVLAHQALTQASDLYAVGLMLYEILVGKHPFETNNPLLLIDRVLNQPVDVSRLDLDPALQRVLHTLLEKNPAERYADADALMLALTQATGRALPQETIQIRESFLQAAAFIGRELELRTLRDALRDLCGGATGSAWLIGGESGVGKSRLMDEIATRALVSNVRVVQGQATTEGDLRYDLWRSALERLILHVDLSDTEAQSLKFILPEIDAILGRETPPVHEAGQVERLKLLIPELFRRASLRQSAPGHQPILLVLEDLQWVIDSAPDGDLIRELLTLTAEIPLMILASYRDDEQPNLPDAFPGMTALKLNRLTEEEVAKLSRSMLGEAGKQSEVVTFLHQQTEGNVFFLVEVVRALAQDAGRINDIGKVTLPARIFAEGVQRVVAHRLNRLPEGARALVDIAAVAGRQINLKLIHALSPALDVEAWLTLCTNLAVFEVVGELYRFAHDKIRETIIAGLPDAEKRLIHRQIAEAIEQAYGDEVQAYAALLTLHYGAAGETVKEGIYAFHAGEQAFKVSHYSEADAFYRRALALQAYQHFEDSRRIEGFIMLGVGRTAYTLGDYDVSRSWTTDAANILQEVGDELGYAEAVNCLGETDFRQGMNDQAEVHVREALRIRERLGTPRDIGYSAMNLGVIYAQRGQIEAAKGFFLECYDAMKQANDDIALARALNNLAIAYDMSGDLLKAEERHQAALTIRRRINDRAGIATSLNNLAGLRSAQGEPQIALPYLEEALAYLRHSGEKLSIATTLSSLGGVYHRLGQIDRAMQTQREALDIRRQMGDIPGISISLNMLARVALDQGDFGPVRAYLREALMLIVTTQAYGRYIVDLLLVCDLYKAEGRIVDAFALADALLPHCFRNPEDVESLNKRHTELKARLTDEQFSAASARFAGWTLPQLAAHFGENG